MSLSNKCSIALILMCNLCWTALSVDVNTTVGIITGITETVVVSSVTYTFNRFLGIPYAKPPVGDLRFAKPQPAESFSKPFNASEFGPACEQLPVPGVDQSENETSEDCLSLNVFVPIQLADSASGHAVMVFVHGGGFVAGSSRDYLAGSLASYGNVIVVTMNYRLGFYGFFATGDSHAPGNAGLWDQQLAFMWIQNNIGSFGGDAGNVLIFGESAGAISVMMHAMYPGNKGLFHRVIAESGAPSTLETMTTERSKAIAAKMSTKLACPTNDSATMVACLRSKSVPELTAKFLEMTMSSTTDDMLITQLMPAVDGDFIKIAPREIAKRPDVDDLEEVKFFRSIDLLSGYNLYEGATYVGSAVAVGDPDGFSPTRQEMKADLIPTAIYLSLGIRYPDLVLTLIDAEYTDWMDPNNTENIRMQYVKMAGDLSFVASTLEYALLHADANGSSYLYHFLPKPTKHVMQTASWVDGANHGDEEPYVWGFSVAYMGNDDSRDLWEYVLSYAMMNYWSNFAKTGNPNLPRSTVSPVWTEYNVTSRSYLEFNKDANVVKQNLGSQEANFWLNVVPTAAQFKPTNQKCDTDVNVGSGLRSYTTYIILASLWLFLLNYERHV